MTPEFKFRLMKSSGLNNLLFEEMREFHQEHYKCYSIKQKGKLRQIEEPMPMLMLLQKGILLEIKDLPLHPSCVARPGMSIKDNAAFHAGAKHLLKIDIKGCYQSIQMDYTVFVGHCEGWLTDDLAAVLSACFYYNGKEWHLPTGAPTSPMLCNLALAPVDKIVSELANQYGYQYTRYLDDLILSTRGSERHWKLIEDVKAVLIDHDFLPHPTKCKWYSGKNDRFIVTGVNIAGKVSAPREIKRLTRTRLHSLATKGKDIDNVTRGYLAHVKDIDPSYYLYLMAYYKRKKTLHVAPQ